jgi:hypothetical protein
MIILLLISSLYAQDNNPVILTGFYEYFIDDSIEVIEQENDSVQPIEEPYNEQSESKANSSPSWLPAWGFR